MIKIPELKNEKLDDAKEILSNAGIKYEENEEKEISLSVRRGRVTRTEPKENKIINDEQKVTIYVSKLCLLPFFLILLFLIIAIFLFSFVGTAIINGRPTIARTHKGWVKSDVVYVTKDVDVQKLDKYEYCITKNRGIGKCEWKETKTKNTELSETGKWNVFFRGKYKNGKYSSVSNRVQVLIDNTAPVVSKTEKNETATTLKYNVTATDIGSGIKDYYYKIGNRDYKKVDSNFVINGLDSNTEYTITIRVVDNTGNVYELTFKDKTNQQKDNNNDKTDTTEEKKTTTKSTTTTKIETTTKKIETSTTNNVEDITTESTTTTTTNSTKPIEPEIEIPKIDLNDVPSVFEYGSNYQLPSHVEFGKSGGTYSCALNHDWSKNIENTKDIAVGTNTISCKAISNTGSYAEVSKEIKVTVPEGEDEEWDGWIRLNLYYPVGTTNHEWRIYREGEIRGKDDIWEAYTGPILVKISDISNVYIRYNLASEKVIEAPNGKVLVSIEPDNMELEGDKTTKVKIVYDKKAKKSEYRINGGEWQSYSEEFVVPSDTLIEARAEREDNVYDNEGNVIMTKTVTGTDAVYISEKASDPLDFGSVSVKINPEKRSLSGNEITNVEIIYEKDAITRMYKVGNGPWLEYTGIFSVSKNTTITAFAESKKSITLDNGIVREGIATGSDRVRIRETGSADPIDPDSSGENRLKVYVKPSSYRVLNNQKAKVNITSNEANAKLYYSFDNSNYIEYTGSFEVGANTYIYAMAEYEGKRAYSMRFVGAVEVTDYLEGPMISVDPTTVTESVDVNISTKEEAKNIYYSIDGNTYQEYKESFKMTKNAIIRSYYIRTDNKKSETTYYYVQNVKVPKKPYVRIDAKPSMYLSEDVDMVEVSISGTNYNSLEYSFNGIEYYPYNGPLQITQSKSIYAKGTNENGSTIEKLNITTSIAPIPIEKLDVAITLSPEEKDLTGLIDKLEVTIDYDERATGKYYRLDNGDLQEYKGPFEVNENTTVYAYAISEKGIGKSSKQINYLTTGIASPIITVSPDTPAEWVRVEINYAPTASVKKYKINNGEWLDYYGPIELITNNTKVTAYNEDVLGHHEETEVLVDNIIPRENIYVLDNGMYYLIKLNYPSSSKKEDREYKWKKDGTWKKYDEQGILLIRPECKDKVISADGVKIKDSTGKEIIMKDHYYVLDVPLSELIENLFMRWDLSKPSVPTFIVSTNDWAKEVSVGINYDETSVEKLYKIVYEDGETTGWLNYEEPVKIDKNNAIIYAKGINEVEIASEIGSKKITNIDITKPEIEDVKIIKKGSSNFTLEVTSNDEASGIDGYIYTLDNDENHYSDTNTYTLKNLKIIQNTK